MLVRLSLIALLLTGSMICIAQTSSRSSMNFGAESFKHVEKGIQLLEKNKVSKAKAAFKKAIKEQDIQYMAHAYLGIIAAVEKEPEQAKKHFEDSMSKFKAYKEQLLRNKKDYLKNLESRAISLRIELDQHNMQQSGEDNAAQKESQHHDMAARVKELTKDYEKAQEMKYNAFFRFKYGNLLWSLKNQAGAKEQYLLAVDADPEFKDVYANLTVCYFIEGDCPNALATFKKGKDLKTPFHPKLEEDLLNKCKE